MRSRSLFTFPAAIALSCLFALPAGAQQMRGGFSVNHFSPSERGSEWFVLDSLDFRGHLRPAAGLVGDWASRPLALYNGNGSLRAALVENQVTLHAGASVVFWERLRVGFDLPLQVYANGNEAAYADGLVFLPPAHASSLGDLRISADARLFGSYGDPVTVAVGASVWLPTGDPASYSGDPKARIAPHALLAGDVGPFVYAGSLGFVYRDNHGFGDDSVGSALTLGASAGVRVLDRKLVVGPELFGDTVIESSASAFAKRASPLEGLLGAHYSVLDALRLGAAVGTGLVHGYGSPTFRGVLSIEWAPVAEPTSPEVLPVEPSVAPLDRDQDGIVDASDACPNLPGVASEISTQNGCPAPADADGDHVLDTSDACPSLPGVASSDPKQNGCPAALDADRDGVLDKDDACPAVAGPKRSDPKQSGCPDLDQDKDGVPNESDACPDEAGNADPDPKRNGCPKAFVKNGQIKIQDQVTFGNGSGQILPVKSNQDVLEAVLTILQQHPEIKGLSIEGYSDSVGSAESNKNLSQRRAAAVLNWLVAHGVARTTLQSAGFGSEKPIDSNDTAAGRANNRRVEFRILDSAPGAAASQETKQ